VLADLEEVVHTLMEAHEAKRVLWFPSELLAPPPDTDPDHYVSELRKRAQGISLPMRVALALNLLTEEGLPHFHRPARRLPGERQLLDALDEPVDGEEDRHGAVLHDYARDSRVLDNPVLERMQFEYLKAGFEPAWDKDPYRVFVYTTLQERATQVSHANTGKLAGEYEPTDRRRCSPTWPRRRRGTTRSTAAIFARCSSATRTARSARPPRSCRRSTCPGVSMPHFREMADVIRRAGIYGPRDYLKIVEEQIRFWAIDTLTGLDEAGQARAGEDPRHPERLERVADAMEARSRAKSFSFAVAFGKEFSMA
jgi:acyl-[acyl-carrier-protein] desaturase